MTQKLKRYVCTIAYRQEIEKWRRRVKANNTYTFTSTPLECEWTLHKIHETSSIGALYKKILFAIQHFNDYYAPTFTLTISMIFRSSYPFCISCLVRYFFIFIVLQSFEQTKQKHTKKYKRNQKRILFVLFPFIVAVCAFYWKVLDRFIICFVPFYSDDTTSCSKFTFPHVATEKSIGLTHG